MYLFLPRKCHGSGFLIAGFYLKYSSFSPVIMYTNVLGVRNKVLDIFKWIFFYQKKFIYFSLSRMAVWKELQTLFL